MFEAKSSSPKKLSTTSRRQSTHHWLASILLVLSLCSVAHSQLPADYVDDFYHCDDPQSEQNIIDCDEVTFEWNLDQLLANAPPEACSQTISRQIDDVDEPCQLWNILYGADAPCK